MELKINIENPEQGVANYEPLKAWALEHTSIYKGLIVDETAITEAKADVASLRKMAKAVSDMRIKVKKEHEAKIAATIDQMTELSKIFTDAAAEIDNQIKAFDERRKEEKRAVCEKIYTAEIGDLAELIPFEKLFKPAWLNKTTSEKMIRGDIQTAAINAKDFLANIKGDPHETEIAAAYFDRLSIMDALNCKTRLEQMDATMSARSAAVDTPRAEIPAEQKPVEDLPDFTETPEIDDVSASSMSFAFVVTDCTEKQFEQLVAFLENGGYNYAMEV